MASVPDEVFAEVRNTYGRVAYTHKTHEKDAERKRGQAWWIKIDNVAVIGVTAAAAILAPLLETAWAAWVAAASAIIALVFAAFQLSFDPAGEANGHTLAAKSYLALRDDYRRLIADAGGLSLDILRARRDELAKTLQRLNESAPPTSNKAYDQARQALRGTEELAFSDEEYLHLLDPRTDDAGRSVDPNQSATS